MVITAVRRTGKDFADSRLAVARRERTWGLGPNDEAGEQFGETAPSLAASE